MTIGLLPNISESHGVQPNKEQFCNALLLARSLRSCLAISPLACKTSFGSTFAWKSKSIAAEALQDVLARRSSSSDLEMWAHDQQPPTKQNCMVPGR